MAVTFARCGRCGAVVGLFRGRNLSCSSASPTAPAGSSSSPRKKRGSSSHNYIGTEHILLGLIHEPEGVAAKALESLGISLEASARTSRR